MLVRRNRTEFRDCNEQAIIAHGNGSLGQRKLASLLLNTHDDEM